MLMSTMIGTGKEFKEGFGTSMLKIWLRKKKNGTTLGQEMMPTSFSTSNGYGMEIITIIKTTTTTQSTGKEATMNSLTSLITTNSGSKLLRTATATTGTGTTTMAVLLTSNGTTGSHTSTTVIEGSSLTEKTGARNVLKVVQAVSHQTNVTHVNHISR